jgi:hypothetical protein
LTQKELQAPSFPALSDRHFSTKCTALDIVSIWNREEKVNRLVNVVEVPIWPPILLIAGLAATPWIP